MKKRIYVFVGAAAMLFFLIKDGYCQQAEKSLLLTIGEGENIAYGESCIPASTSKDNLYIVTQKDNEIFVYEDGNKSGPFKSFDDAGIKDCGDAGKSTECSTYEYNGSNDLESYISYDDNGNMKIKFNGTLFGPYPQIYSFTVSDDKDSFTAIVSEDDSKNHMINSKGADVVVAGIPDNVAVSPSANKVIYTVSVPPDENYMNTVKELSKTNFDNMTPEEIQKFTKKVEESGINSYQEKVYLLTSDNKKFGPYVKDSITDPGFCKTGGDNWYMLMGDKLYVNGKAIPGFDASSVDPCNIWISDDGKRYAALVNYEKIIFSDGTSYPYPLEIEPVMSNGRVALEWVSLENKRDIVLYIKYL